MIPSRVPITTLTHRKHEAGRDELLPLVIFVKCLEHRTVRERHRGASQSEGFGTRINCARSGVSPVHILYIRIADIDNDEVSAGLKLSPDKLPTSTNLPKSHSAKRIVSSRTM